MSSTWSVEVESQAPATRLFKAAFTEWCDLGHKNLRIIPGIKVLSGDGGPGSIREIRNYTLYSKIVVPFDFVRERLDFIDHEKLELKITLLDGGDLGKTLESASSHIKVEPKGDGSVVKLVVTHQVIAGADASENVEKVKNYFVQIVKAVEKFLLAHPGTYT